MNTEPPTGDDLQRLLVTMKQEVLQRASTTPQTGAGRPSWARRHLGLTVGLVALLGVGGVTGALALGLPPALEARAPGPTTTPTSEPSTAPPSPASPTPAVPPADAPAPSGPPRPAADLDCAALGDRVGITTLGEGIAPYEEGAWHYSPTTASQTQAGVLDCRWTPGGESYAVRGATVVVSPAADRGREWIDGLTASGLPSLGLGDASAVRCGGEDGDCNSSVVAGPWWIEVSGYDHRLQKDLVTLDEVRAVASEVLALLDGRTPPPAWQAPATTWTTDGGCAPLSAADVAGVLGDAPVTGPEPSSGGGSTGIATTQTDALTCSWTAAWDDPTAYQANWGLEVRWTPGSAWTAGTELQDGVPVDVAGAEGATWWCIEDEGAACVVDVVQDGTWIQVSGGHDETDAGRARLIAAAEEVLAAHAAG